MHILLQTYLLWSIYRVGKGDLQNHHSLSKLPAPVSPNGNQVSRTLWACPLAYLQAVTPVLEVICSLPFYTAACWGQPICLCLKMGWEEDHSATLAPSLNVARSECHEPLCHHRPPEIKGKKRARQQKAAAINLSSPVKELLSPPWVLPEITFLPFSPSPPTGQKSFTSQELGTLVKCQ